MKKQRLTKKLVLNRETMRRMDEVRLQKVEGGLGTLGVTRAFSCDPESVYFCEHSQLITC